MPLQHMPHPHFLSVDAECLVRARAEAGRIHAARDIRAAGNQVEIQARQIFARRLPARYRIAHGHVADYRGFVSPQVDVIVVDAFNAPTLFETSDGTEYVPFESVFAIGEVKSTYYRAQRPIEKAIETIHDTRTGLFREATKRNPFFYFMLFVNSGELDLQAVADVFNTTPLEDLPNTICWLDRGTLLYARLVKNGLGEFVPLNYLLSPSTDRDAADNHAWAFIPWGAEERRMESNLAAQIGILAQHMEQCVLDAPNLQRYVTLLGSDKYVLLS
jgi:hypothetical protein